MGRLASKLLQICASTVFVLGAAETHAGTIALAWDPVPTATGYKVYYGTQSGVYSTSSDVGNTTTTTLSNLADCTTWYVAVKAYNAAGQSPQFSGEVSGWPAPIITSATPAGAKQGDQLTVDLTGKNFPPGARAEIDNSHVVLQSTQTLACDRLQMLVTIEPTAQDVRPAAIGFFGVTVVDPDSVFGSKSNVFEVRINPTRFDINRSQAATDGRLDGADTVWMARLFGGQEGGPLYDPDADLNGDGWVDGVDLAYIASNFGRCWTGSTWNAAACPAQAH